MPSPSSEARDLIIDSNSTENNMQDKVMKVLPYALNVG
ncbi:hypothetical protein Taro_017893, partial [Colocasia esculenta]|nr:hypothetical protein [Colocasia esculenta]